MIVWAQTFTIIGVFFALFVYMMNRMDANQKQVNEGMDSNQKENNNKFEAVSKQTNEKFEAVYKQFENMNQRFNALDNWMTSIEADVKSTYQRFDSANQRISDFQMQVNQRFNTLENYILPKKVIYEEVKENQS